MFDGKLGQWLQSHGQDVLGRLTELHEDLKEVGRLNDNLEALKFELQKINEMTAILGNVFKKMVMDNPEILTKIITKFLHHGGTEDTEKKAEDYR